MLMKYWLMAFLFALIYSGCCAQPAHPEYEIRQYNSENGLPQNSAKDLLFDKNHFLWIATENGVTRFDGQRFRVYNSANTPLIRSNRFTFLFWSAGQQVQMTSGYDRSEIFSITPEYRMTVDTASTLLPHKLMTHRADCLFDCTPLFTWYGAHASPGRDTFFLNELCKADTFDVLNRHEAMIFYKGAFYYLDNLSDELVKLPVSLHGQERYAFSLDDIFCLPDADGHCLFFKNGKEIAVKTDPAVNVLFKRARASDLSIYGKGGLVIVQCHNDIYRLTFRDGVLKAALIFPDLPFLAHLALRSFLLDTVSQRLFVGTANAGLFVVTRKSFNTLVFDSNNIDRNMITSILQLPEGRILTSSGILDKAHPGRNLFFKDAGRPDGHVLYRAADHSIWFSRGRRLLQYDSSFTRELSADSLQLESFLTGITEDHAHTLWISTFSSILKREKDGLHYVLYRYPPFVGHPIQSIAEVSGKLWIAAMGGLYSFDITTGKMDEQPLLPDVYARNIFKARDSSIWIGTYGNGYYKYKDGRFIALPRDPEKYLATAHTFAEDGKGFFWISTNHGLFEIRKKDLDAFDGDPKGHLFYYYYDKTSGFNTNEFNGGCEPASLKDKEGNIYFPSLNGIVYFRPDSILPELPVDGIFIDGISVDSCGVDCRQALRFKPDFNRLAIDIATPFYGSEQDLRVEYKLSTSGEKWYPVNRDGSIVINRLPAGKYALLIRESKGWGPDNFTVSSISFEVLPHWYNTWRFNMLLIVLTLGVAFFLYKLRTRILLLQNRRLQEKVEERTAELERSTVIREKMISVIMHDLRTPLFSQSLLIEHLYGQYKELFNAEVSDLLLQLKDSSKMICQFSTDFLTWYNTQQEGFSIEHEPIALEAFIKELTVFYRQIAERNGVAFECNIPPGLILESDRNTLAIVVRNLVDNAVKYTNSGSIRIGAFSREGRVYIWVRDTGKGISAARIRELLSYAQQTNYTASSTFGYRLIMELMQKLQGSVHLESEPDAGTVVTLTF